MANPQPTMPQRVLGLGALLLTAALVAVVLQQSGSRPAGSPSPGASSSGRVGAGSPSFSPGSPAASRTPRATPAQSLDLAAVEREIARIQQQVAEIRGLEPRSPVENRLLGANEFEAEIRAEFARLNPPERLEAEATLYERLGLLPAGSDLAELALQQVGSSLAGYYRPDRNDMTIIKRSGGFGPLERQVLAHEFTHALQDQHFALEKMALYDGTNSDRSLAQLALVEGDASLVQAKWANENLTPTELTEVIRATDVREQTRLTSGLPPVLLRQGAFPYFDGLIFVTTLDVAGSRGVNAAFSKPPQSTEQILHPEKYRAGEVPIAVVLPSVAARLGTGWRQSVEDTLGEVTVQVWAAQGSGPTASRRSAAGWGGDRVASFDGPNGAWAVLWRTRWDTAADAAEFRSVASDVIERVRGSARVVTRRASNGVDVLLASSPTIAAQLERIAAQ